MADDSKGNDGENDDVDSIHESIESGSNHDAALAQLAPQLLTSPLYAPDGDNNNSPDHLPLIHDEEYHNAQRMDRSMDAVLGAMRVFARAKIEARHKVLLAVRVEAKNTTLGELPPCSKAEHWRLPGDGKRRVQKVNKLNACESCGAWIEALVKDHIDKRPGALSGGNIYIRQLTDPKTGPWRLALAYTESGRAEDIDHADVTCLVNIMLHFKGAFPDLSNDDRAHLEELPKFRNKLNHKSPRVLTTEEMKEGISLCVNLLAEGPWTSVPYKEHTDAAMGAVKGWRDTPLKLMPPLEPLPPHYVPQSKPLQWLSDTFAAAHRVAALSGTGGVGKSTTARAFAWHLARTGACPGRHGVLWGNAANGVEAALADIVQRQLGLHMSPSEASDPTIVRLRLQGWAAQREEPFLLVLDNVEPGSKDKQLLSMLGEAGHVLITTRAGRRALYRDMDISIEAVRRLECLDVDNAVSLMMARFNMTTNTTAASASTPPSLPPPEEAAAHELAGPTALAGLPLALEQAAAMVATSSSKSFVDFLEAFRTLSPAGGVTTRLPGDDGGAGEAATAWIAVVTEELKKAGLEDQLAFVLKECEKLDDVQWLGPDSGQWGVASHGSPEQPNQVQRGRWESFQQACNSRNAATGTAQHKQTLATLWKQQLVGLAAHPGSVELLQGAACFAPDFIPDALFTRALVAWVEAARRDDGGWLNGFAAKSALVKEVLKRLGRVLQLLAHQRRLWRQS